MAWAERRAGLARDLCNILVKTQALQFGIFTLASGRLSSYYIDLRLVPSFPGAFRKVVSIYIELIKNLVGLDSFDAVGGIPTAGLAYTAAVAYELKKPMIYIRREGGERGSGKRVEGLLTPGWKVVVLDDLITTGSSIAGAVRAIRAEGGLVEDAVVLIDRMEGGGEELTSLGVRLNPLANIAELAHLLYEMGLIEEEQRGAIEEQLGRFAKKVTDHEP